MRSQSLIGLSALVGYGYATQNWTSPHVYPSPMGTGAGNWSEAYSKARAMVAKMTLAEMNNITYGVSDPSTGCVGVSGSAPRVGFPGFCLQDAGNGVRVADGVNGYASGVGIGASWNSTLAYERGHFMGAEFKKKGVNVALGPVVGPIGRIAEGGRNWEGFAADPYLDGILGAQTVIGMQESVIASVKHFVAYEQETNRNPSTEHNETVMSTSANVDDQTLHEVYAWPFQDLVYAGAGCIMCSYNRINNTYACENSKTMNGVLKGEMDFQGFVVSDWGGQHGPGDASANAGLDMAMPDSTQWQKQKLVQDVSSGKVNKTRLVDMATRIIATWYQFGQDLPSQPKLGVGIPVDLLTPHEYVDAKDPASRPALLEQAIESHVLVKNVNNALPLRNPGVLSIYGYDAVPQRIYNPVNYEIKGKIFEGFYSNDAAVDYTHEQLIKMVTGQTLKAVPRTLNGTLTVGGGSGANAPAYISSPYDAIQQQAYEDGTALFWDSTTINPTVVGSTDACLVFINAWSTEGYDRTGLTDRESDELVNNVAKQCNNTIVVIHNAGIRLVDAWIDSPNVTAVLFAHLPGQDAGRAIVPILYGQTSPSGRLPYTVAKSAKDYGTLLGPCKADGSDSPQCDFSEGVNIDYRGFLARNVTPQYAFGYGLTYSNFSYSDLQVNINGNPGSNSSTMESLYETVGSVTATIQNTGSVAAAEVPQLYIQTSNMTTRALRGFQKIPLQAGESAQAVFNLRRKDISSWDTLSQAWVVPSGSMDFYVGPNVEEVPLHTTKTLN